MNQNTFSTFDLGLAAALSTLGYELKGLDRSNPRKIKFIFEQDKRIERIIENYFNDKLKVSALSLLNSLKNLKNRIYSDE